MEKQEQEENKNKPEETVPSLKERIEILKEQNEFTKNPMKENIEKPDPAKIKKPEEDQ